MRGENKIESLTNDTRLGSSGRWVSPLCLGTMTFGKDWGIGEQRGRFTRDLRPFPGCRRQRHRYPDGYTGGHSEEMLGDFMADARNRDRMKSTIVNFGL